MTFGRPTVQKRGENTIPMINVVFLLLIFFMISSELRPPPPIEITPPEAAGGAAPTAREPLFVGVDGRVVLGALQGEDVFASLALQDETPTLIIRADAKLPAADLARVMRRLSEIGIVDVALAVEKQAKP